MHEAILVFSCPHFPYNHQDALPFLDYVSTLYGANKIICLGDEVENSALSRFVKNPDLDNAGPETKKAAKGIKELGNLFPNMDLLWSNHGARPYKKAIEAGIPESFLKTPKEILNAPDGWNWHDKLMITLSNGEKCLFRHGISANVIQAVRANGCNIVQGHHHTKFGVEYMASDNQQFWGMTVGCLINPDHPAFSYGVSNLSKPILGCGVIIEGFPITIPMIRDKKGRWNGKI